MAANTTSLKDATISPGIIYISRIPPYMKPIRVKNIFSQHGEIGRVFLQPEDPLTRKRRKKFGGNKKQNYTEGWVEFKDKRVAKRVALMLNNTQVGGKKRSYHHDDIWNIKYLSKFLWTHLTEKIAYDNAVRRQKLHAEVSQARREVDHYLHAVDKKKVNQVIKERKRKAGTLTEEDERGGTTVQSDNHRPIKQRKLETSQDSSSTSSNTSGSKSNSDLSDTLLKKILNH